jgi:transposase
VPAERDEASPGVRPHWGGAAPACLDRSTAVTGDRTATLVGPGQSIRVGHGPQGSGDRRSLPRLAESLAADPDGIDEHLAESLELCARMENVFTLEVDRVRAQLHAHARRIDAVKRLITIPAVGENVALTIYAWVGDVRRFPSASELASYAEMVPSSWQSADTQRHGGITRQGAKELRSILVQAGHVLLWRCQSADWAPLKAAAQRVHTTRARRKIAVVAAGPHILRLAYYVLRDGTRYDPKLLRSATAGAAELT